MGLLSVTAINLCRNILLKSVKMHFLVIQKFWVFKKPNQFVHGAQKIHFFLKIGTSEIVKNRFRQKKESEIKVFEDKCDF